MESNRRSSEPEASGVSQEQVSRTLGNATIEAPTGRGFASWRTVWIFSRLCARVDVTKSLEVSSHRLKDSGTSLQNRPKVSVNTKRRPNLFRNRIDLEVPFLASTTLELP